VTSSSPAAPPSRPAATGRASFSALGGTAVVLTAAAGAVDVACDAVRAEVEAMDLACSRFRPDSELSQVNAAAGELIAVGELFAEALETALRAAALTAGAVDPTCGVTLESAGYDRDFERLRAEGIAISVGHPVAAPGWRTIEWDRSRRMVRIRPGTRLDFGATAKALAADRAARAAWRAAGCGVLVSLSRDLAVYGPAPDGGWRVRVTDDHRAGDQSPGQTVILTDGGLATSSTTVRRWSAGGVELHHIVDPRRGRSADSPWRTVSVAAASCVDANTASTAAIVRGEAAVPWLTGLGLPARLVRRDGGVVAVGGWPAEPGPADGTDEPFGSGVTGTEVTHITAAPGDFR
jgi:FAD:protein FMN transferase